MQKLESIFEKDSGFDHKNITLKCDKVVPQKFLDAIEAGVTSEELDEFSRAGLKIFKYKTQITVHGVFGELQKKYVAGYANLFQNKNLSIGIRYGAIDECKRKRLAEKLRYAGFHYKRNSTGHGFEIVKEINKSNFEERKAYMLDMKSKIDTSLFTGGVYLFTGQAFGITYICLEVHVSIIPEKNVDKLWQGIISQETIDAKVEAKRIETEERHAYYAEQARLSKEREAASLEAAKEDIARLDKAFPKSPIICTEAGTYLKVGTDHNGDIEFEVTSVYKPKGARMFRYNKTSYKTIDLALKHEVLERSWDSTFQKSGKVPHYRIDAPAPTPEKTAKAKAEVQAVKADGLSLIRYSDKCYAVIGETKPIKETLAKLGCKFNGHLNVGNEKQPGWLVWGNILDKVATALQLPIPA